MKSVKLESLKNSVDALQTSLTSVQQASSSSKVLLARLRNDEHIIRKQYVPLDRFVV